MSGGQIHQDFGQKHQDWGQSYQDWDGPNATEGGHTGTRRRPTRAPGLVPQRSHSGSTPGPIGQHSTGEAPGGGPEAENHENGRFRRFLKGF